MQGPDDQSALGGGPLKVLFVSTYFSRGGAERVVSTLLKFLDRSRVRPSLCVLRDDTGYPIPEDVPVHYLGFGRYWHLPRTVRRLRALIEETRPEVVVGNVNATNLAVGEALRRSRARPKWIARIGNNPSLNRSLARDMVARRVFPAIDRWVANSEGLAGEVVRYYPYAEGRIHVLRNPVDFEEIDQLATQPPAVTHDGEEPLLIAVGRLAREKRYDVLLDAMAELRKTVPAILWICGEGPERSVLESQIDELGLVGSVRLLGYCENPFPLLKQADLFVMSSDYEGSPNALIEAQGLGLPAVVTDCPYGPAEIVVHNKTGILLPAARSDLFSSAIASLTQDARELHHLSAGARIRARRRFEAPANSSCWELLVEQLLEEASS